MNYNIKNSIMKEYDRYKTQYAIEQIINSLKNEDDIYIYRDPFYYKDKDKDLDKNKYKNNRH